MKQAITPTDIKPGTVYWILSYLGYVLLPFAGELTLWLLVCFAAIAVWRVLILRLGWYQPGSLARAAMAILMFFIVYKTQGGVFGRDAGLALLIVMTSLKLLELRNRRDAIICTLLGFLLILGSFLFSQSLLLALYSFFGVAIGFACLYQVNFDGPIAIKKRFQLSFQLIVISLPLMLALYFLFPRLPVGLFALPGASGATTGLSEDMSPGSINSLSQSDKPAFHAAFLNTQQVNGPFYWRAIILWQFDGRTWHRQTPRFRPNIDEAASGNTLNYEIIMQQDARWIPSLRTAITGPSGSRLLPGMIYRWPRHQTSRRRYRLTSITDYRNSDLYRAEYRASLQLPVTSPRVKQLANSWHQQYQNKSDIVKAALRYFRQQEFYYTLKPPLLGGDPVDEFLFERRQGFCEHFASAFVVLMRQAGIPARVVTGFLGAEYNATGGFYTVRQSDAHAWAEVWLSESGWTRVDPTQAVAPERIEYGMDAFRRMRQQGYETGQQSEQQIKTLLQLGFFNRTFFALRQQWDIINVSWYRWTVGFDTSRQKQFLESFNLNWSRWITHALGLLGTITLTTALAMLLLFRNPKKRSSALRSYDRFCQLFKRRGLPRYESEGPLTYGQRLCARFPHLATDIDQFLSPYILHHYGDKQADISSLNKLIKKLRVGLRQKR
ncbi:MAG: DUF3488 domain-containing transglutaminase family protein [Proteobacteria bacterium]|nr:DUF3488 domain-containing transglutaminase family protein [Pseudomonadota bacterium]